MANCRQLSAIPAVVSALEGQRTKVAQRLVHKALETLEGQALFRSEVRRRTARWRPRDMGASCLTTRMARILGLVRPRVALATYWLWFNAWPTRARFGGGNQHCLFCGEGRDEVGHYTRCKVVCRAHELAFGMAPPWRWCTFFSTNAEVCDRILAAQTTVTWALLSAHGFLRREVFPCSPAAVADFWAAAVRQEFAEHPASTARQSLRFGRARTP